MRKRDPAGLDHDAVIADHAWLDQRLAALGMELIIGTLGEKRAASDDAPAERAMSWSDITYVGLLVPGKATQTVGPLLQVQRLV